MAISNRIKLANRESICSNCQSTIRIGSQVKQIGQTVVHYDCDDVVVQSENGTEDNISEIRIKIQVEAEKQARLVKQELLHTLDTRLTTCWENIQIGNESHMDAVKMELSAFVEAKCSEIINQSSNIVSGMIGNELSKAVIELRSNAPKQVEHRFYINDETKPIVIDGVDLHPSMPRMLRLAKNKIPIFLVGPTGCGKTTIAKKLAEFLENRFGAISCTSGLTEAKLIGRSVPNITTGENVYVKSQLVDFFENGGLFLFDEFDACDPNCLLIVNMALANDELPVPDRIDNPIAKRHPNFVAIAAANTFGTGATRRFCGRNQLDEATLDRFRAGTIAMEYNETLEKQLCPDGNLLAMLWTWRRRIEEHKIEKVLSTRFIEHAYKMVKAGDTPRDLELAFFAGWKPENLILVLGRETI